MLDQPESTKTQVLDEWISEVGEARVLAEVDALKAAIADGSAKVLRDRKSLRAYWDSRRRQTA